MHRSSAQTHPHRICLARLLTLVAALLAGAALITGCGTAHHAQTASTSATALTQASTGSTAASSTAAAPAPRPRAPRRAAPARRRATPAEASLTPPIVWDPIDFGAQRKAEMVAYAMRHYGLDTYKLINPHVIVIHFTESPDFQSTYNTFAPDTPDSELHELPNTCAHFVIDAQGVIHQLVPVDIMCRHTVGLNWTAIGIEHVGYSDQQVLGDNRQMTSSLRLVRWLRCRFGITIANVIGHNESLSSPYHHEGVAALRTQTHSDFNQADMQIYRSRLAALGPCPSR